MRRVERRGKVRLLRRGSGSLFALPHKWAEMTRARVEVARNTRNVAAHRFKRRPEFSLAFRLLFYYFSRNGVVDRRSERIGTARTWVIRSEQRLVSAS